MAYTILLATHIFIGIGTLIVTILPLLNIYQLQKLFVPGYFGVAVSGIGLVALTQHSLKVACVRFLSIMFIILGARVVAYTKVRSAKDR